MSGRLCTIPDCEKREFARGWCTTHWRRWSRHGDPLAYVGTPMSDHPGYWAVHKRLRAERGPASDHDCVDCGGGARDWSYDGTDPDPLLDSARHPYSADLSHYEPRCRACHMRQDERLPLPA